MNKTIKIIIGLLVVVALVWLVGAKGKSSPDGFNLGLISILSGDYAVVGENIRNGVILANEEYNQAHPETPINLVVENDGFNGGTGLSAYRKLTTVDNIDALINVSTPTVDAIYEAVTATNLPVIQLGEQGREPSDDNVIGIFPSSIASEYDYGVYLRNKGITQMDLVYTNIDAMVRFVDSFKKGFQGSTTDFIIQADESDFRTHALKVAVANPTTLGLFIVPQQGAQFMKEFMKVKKTNPQLFFDANFQSGFSDYQRILGDLKILDGTLIGTVDSIVADSFKEAYKKRFNSEAGFLADMGYYAFNLLVSSYDKDQVTWLNNIKQASYDGVSGKIEFDAAGNRQPKTKVMVVKECVISDIE